MMIDIRTKTTLAALATALLLAAPSTHADVMLVNPSPGTYIPVTGSAVPYAPAAYAPAAAWPWGWNAPSPIPWTVPVAPTATVTGVAPAATPVQGVAAIQVPSGYPVAYPQATGVTYVTVPVTAPVAGAMAAPVAMAPASVGYLPQGLESILTLDRLIAAAETADEVRILLSRSDRLRIVRADNVTRTFLKERIVNAEVARASGLTQEYLGWVYDTLLEAGDRLGPNVFLPNFRLLPSASAASWNQVWSRSFAASYTAQAWGRQGLAVLARTATLRAEATSGSAGLQRLAAGSQVAVTSPALAGVGGPWVQVRTANGFLGWVTAADLSASFGQPAYAAPTAAPAASALPYAGPESLILWNDPRRVPAGHDSAYGWIYPAGYQFAEPTRGASTR